MNQTLNHDDEDDLCPEYDFNSLQVVACGSGRKPPTQQTVELAPDVAEVFPDAAAVNQALRFLIRITKTAAHSQ